MFPDVDLGVTNRDHVGQVHVQKILAASWLGGAALLPEQSAWNLEEAMAMHPMERRHHPLAYAPIYFSYL